MANVRAIECECIGQYGDSHVKDKTVPSEPKKKLYIRNVYISYDNCTTVFCIKLPSWTAVLLVVNSMNI